MNQCGGTLWYYDAYSNNVIAKSEMNSKKWNAYRSEVEGGHLLRLINDKYEIGVDTA